MLHLASVLLVGGCVVTAHRLDTGLMGVAAHIFLLYIAHDGYDYYCLRDDMDPNYYGLLLLLLLLILLLLPYCLTVYLRSCLIYHAYVLSVTEYFVLSRFLFSVLSAGTQGIQG